MDKLGIIESKFVKHQALTYDDVLLLPNYTDIKREETDISTILHPKIKLKLPIVSAPMDTVTESAMAIAMAQSGGLGIIHRNMSVEDEATMIASVKAMKVEDVQTAAVDDASHYLIGAAVGVGRDFEERVKALVKAGVDLICVDSSHGHSKFVMEAVAQIRSWYPTLPIMAGNVATYGGGRAMIESGADIIRVGMGPGSICTTRIVSGMGVPQISAVLAVVRATQGSKATVLADGGIRQMGDIAKALAFGASAVMLGSLLAGYDQSPGDVIEYDGKKLKSYRGMGSISAMKKGGAERYGQSVKTEEKKLIAEGVDALVTYKGEVKDYLHQAQGSLRTAFYYLGARNIQAFFETSRVMKISQAGLLESHPHEVSIVDAGGNYRL